ncbi:MotA/TolQ/ExbB proton channel family protein [Cardinium endosymbiont of Dermatophagoides farinae]|uniref:MotA/TolQ/ExbB proton channel family protein n=1 Tax=Cardinium endosymbiont of Dermatophagoides farinae TaxID=2597823 RepID=UPI001182A22E|nr:MotA/TolQ/ExbB proton channel family protein [Cardinium endosymbiont of Dermatophagoides farinae]TSJ81454.1 MotA/TolQ/ExbB proton channel family protein [Cardinium endosymbiont of Dermatophagoides farinae]
MTIYTTLLGLLLKGGWLMFPLLLLSLISIYIIVERLFTYRKYLNFSSSFLETIEEAIDNGDASKVQQICMEQDNIIQKVISKGIEQRQASNITLVLENESSRVVSFLEEKLSLLATIAGAAPMIGFLGTVTGMIQTFMAISQEKHQLSSQVFSGGIYQAMITTVAGLIVGIIAYLGYNYCVAQVNKATVRLSYLVNLFLTKVR